MEEFFEDPTITHRRLCILENRISQLRKDRKVDYTFNTALGPRTVTSYIIVGEDVLCYDFIYREPDRTLFRIVHTRDLTLVDNFNSLSEEAIRLAIFEIENIVDNLLMEKNREEQI